MESFDWKALLGSEPMIALLAMIVMWFWNWLKARQQWETERWEGMVAEAYLAAEKAGITTGGKTKLTHALGVFGQVYVKHYNKTPSLKDLEDAASDLAKQALAAKKPA